MKLIIGFVDSYTEAAAPVLNRTRSAPLTLGSNLTARRFIAACFELTTRSMAILPAVDSES